MRTVINIIVCCLWMSSVHAQDTLTVAQLEPFTYSFSVENGMLIGEGGDFLKQEIAKAQFTMIGEYHGSKRISEFTNAVIPILNQLGCKTMALEVGPITGELLNTLEGNVEQSLKQLHQEYLTKEEDGYVNTPFPFFDYKEDAQFLQTAKDASWNVFGIDQEFYDSYVMLIDKMYNNLNAERKKEHKDLYDKMREELQQFYLDDQSDKQNLHVSISKSERLKDFLKAMASEVKNLEIIEALKQSSAIYLLYNQRQWYENNATRIKYMKAQLRRGLSNSNFDLSKDRMLIKMGGYHLSKGFSPLSLYEVGNTLNEIAEYHGNTALNIGFMSRYAIEDGELKDYYTSENRYFKNFKDLLQMGKEDEWVMIDLRRLIKGYFYYPQRYKLNPKIAELVQRYDLLVIPKTEEEGTLIYD
ncbi:hypothetical protein [Winogradskyella tangerina]|uniref:hypothetical protein n=1 Tax=Winogradskyella tangerina TaxID=2023240 RepID=UPI001300A0EB|nr:hypothetical protein [Winogradskyella tangerina]